VGVTKIIYKEIAAGGVGGCVEGNNLSQYRVKWRAVLNTVVNLSFTKCGKFLG